MPRIFLNAGDGKQQFAFDISFIYTETYNKKIGKREIHAPVAAKIIYRDMNKIYSLVFELPVIKVDDVGDIYIWTNTSIDDSQQKNKIELSRKEQRWLVGKSVFFDNKSLIGMSVEDNWASQDAKARIQANKLKAKPAPGRIGGGL